MGLFRKGRGVMAGVFPQALQVAQAVNARALCQ